MNKQEALNVLFKCAELYSKNLEGRNLLFISLNKYNKFNYIEVIFTKSNYLHLTGITIDEKKMSASYFFKKCLAKRLSIDEFDFRTDGTTILKLSVLEKVINIFQNTKMIGDFNGAKPVLYTDKLAGGIVACMGFKKDNKLYVPVTVLKEDIRNLIANQERVVAIFAKSINQRLYSNLMYSVNGIDGDIKIPDEILCKIDLTNLMVNFVEKNIISNSILKIIGKIQIEQFETKSEE